LHKETKQIACSFDFLRYTFKPRKCRKSNGELCWGYGAAISIKSQSKILQTIRNMGVLRCTELSLQQISIHLRAKLTGWIRYYGQYRLKMMSKVFQALNHRLIRLLQKKYKLSSYRQSKRRFLWIIKHFPNLFVHWQYGFTPLRVREKFRYEEPYDRRLSRTVP